LKRIRALALLVGAFLVAAVSGAWADTRIALVIGNARYLNTPALGNPGNDAMDVAAALSDIGFKVTLRLDASKRQFDQALAQFSRDARKADAALFYYAGHGMQFQGRNFLMPVDAELRDEISLRYEMTTIDEVKDALRVSDGVKILVLDSCRDNPLADQLVRSIVVSSRDVPHVQGFAREEGANGMVIVYSTQADAVAHDGGGRNSPFSAAFLKELKEPGLEVGALFRRVESDVFAATNGQQSPELSISMVPEYYLNQSETDQTVWARVRANADAPTLKAFLARYPHSFYAPDAESRLDLIEGQARKEAAKAVSEPTPAPATVAAQIREELRRLGCYAGGDLGWEAPAFKLGVARYVRYANLANTTPSPDQTLLDDMKKRRAGLCPPECSPREVALDGRCVAKTCPAGALLASTGACVDRPPARDAETGKPPRHPRPHPGAGGGRCFSFNGSQYCE
jgi:hypothetical protein